MNLGTNAGHAMPAGGVLSVSLDRIHVTKPEATACGDLHKGEYVRVTVQDTGVGMSREISIGSSSRSSPPRDSKEPGLVCRSSTAS